MLEANYHALDASVKKTIFKDVYRVLVTGEVNGQENTWSNVYLKRFFEVQDGTTETNHSYLGYLGYVVFFGATFWNSLTDKDRTGLQRIFDEVTSERNHLAQSINHENRQRIIDAGGVIRVLSDLQAAAWKHAMQPVWSGRF